MGRGSPYVFLRIVWEGPTRISLVLRGILIRGGYILDEESKLRTVLKFTWF